MSTSDAHDTGTSDIVELDRRAVALSTSVVDEVTEADLDRATPCAGWTVRDLLQHMASQHYGFAAAARGDGADPESWAAPEGSAADPVGAYRQAAAEIVGAFAVADLDETGMTLPDFGGVTFPARRAMTFHFIDYLVHAWDVGASIGIPVRPDEDLLAPALAITLAVPTGDARTRPGAAFEPQLGDDEPDADTWERILRFLGRNPDWAP